MYNGDMGWNDWSNSAAGQAQQMSFALREGLNAYNEWQSFRAGRTNAELATVFGKPEAQVAEMDACFAALKELYDAANNVAVSQTDRFYSMRKFS